MPGCCHHHCHCCAPERSAKPFSVVLAVAGLVAAAAAAKAIVHVLAIVIIATGVVAGLAAALVIAAMILRSRRGVRQHLAPLVISGRVETRVLAPPARAITAANHSARGELAIRQPAQINRR